MTTIVGCIRVHIFIIIISIIIIDACGDFTIRLLPPSQSGIFPFSSSNRVAPPFIVFPTWYLQCKSVLFSRLRSPASPFADRPNLCGHKQSHGDSVGSISKQSWLIFVFKNCICSIWFLHSAFVDHATLCAFCRFAWFTARNIVRFVFYIRTQIRFFLLCVSVCVCVCIASSFIHRPIVRFLRSAPCPTILRGKRRKKLH